MAIHRMPRFAEHFFINSTGSYVNAAPACKLQPDGRKIDATGRKSGQEMAGKGQEKGMRRMASK